MPFSVGLFVNPTVNGLTHNYVLEGSSILAETYGNTTLRFVYDNTGIIGLYYNGTLYMYEKNLQGDVVAILDSSLTRVVEYAYDAWGNILSTSGSMASTLGAANPIRYRSYYYDTETGWYYLQSRYYNPVWGRFISADKLSVIEATPMELTDKNLYAYCDNNPVMRVDGDGEFWHIVAGAVVGAVVGGVSAAIESYKETGSVDPKKVLLKATIGAIGGAVGATGLGTLAQATISAGLSVAENIGNSIIDGKQVDWRSVALDAGCGFTISLAGSVVTNKIFKNRVDFAEDVIADNVDYVSQQLDLRAAGERYWKKGTKKAIRAIQKASCEINVYRGWSSVIGTVGEATVSFAKNLFEN